MSPRLHIYRYLSAQDAGLIAADHRVHDRQNDDVSLGGIPVGTPERSDPGRVDA